MTSRIYSESSDDEATARSDDIETGKSDIVKSEDGEIHDVSPHPIELVESHSKKRKAYTRRTGNKIALLSELQHYVIIITIKRVLRDYAQLDVNPLIN